MDRSLLPVSMRWPPLWPKKESGGNLLSMKLLSAPAFFARRCCHTRQPAKPQQQASGHHQRTAAGVFRSESMKLGSCAGSGAGLGPGVALRWCRGNRRCNNRCFSGSGCSFVAVFFCECWPELALQRLLPREQKR